MNDAADGVRQLSRAQRQPGHDAKAATAAALDAPEQIRIGAGVGDARHAVGGDDLGLEQACGGEAIRFEKLPKPPLWISPATPTERQPPPCT